MQPREKTDSNLLQDDAREQAMRAEADDSNLLDDNDRTLEEVRGNGNDTDDELEMLEAQDMSQPVQSVSRAEEPLKMVKKGNRGQDQSPRDMMTHQPQDMRQSYQTDQGSANALQKTDIGGMGPPKAQGQEVQARRRPRAGEA